MEQPLEEGNRPHQIRTRLSCMVSNLGNLHLQMIKTIWVSQLLEMEGKRHNQSYIPKSGAVARPHHKYLKL